MSYNEYNDLLLKCQNTGKYRVFTFDIVNSSKREVEESIDLHDKAIALIERVYQDIRILEDILERRILIHDEGFNSGLEDITLRNEGQVPQDWFITSGDVVGLTIHNNSICRDIVYKIFDLNAMEMGLVDFFHKYDLVYETNKYSEGSDKYFRGYAIQASSNMHKPNHSSLRKKIDSIREELDTSDDIDYYMDIIFSNHHIALEKAYKRLKNNKLVYIKK